MVPKPEPCPHAARVLLIEDEVLIRSLLAEELRDAGLTVVEAARADEALSYIRTTGQVDLVFTDIQMPGPLNGLELARQIRTAYPALPIILTSGSARPGSLAGLGLFVPKPYSLSRAVALVFDALGLRPPPAEAAGGAA